MSVRVSRHFPWVLATLLALAHAVLALTATTEKCVAFDEVAHLIGGQSYWEHHDFRIHPENGNLPQRLAALPTRVLPWRLPEPEHPAWRTSDVWRLAITAFYEMGNDTDFTVLVARSAMTLHAIGIALLVFAWTRRLFGLPGAFTALLFCILCPTLLAHGPLATSDVAMAFWMLAATGAYWRFLHQPSWLNALLSALCLGCAAVAKFSAPLLAPIWVLLWAARSSHPSPLPFGVRHLPRNVGRAALVLVLTCGLVAGAIAIVWTFYGWRSTAFGDSLPPGGFFRSWDAVAHELGPRAGLIAWLRTFPLLPEAYNYALANIVAYSQARGAFLNGEVSVTGWVTFFPYAFLVKTPFPLLAALGLTAAIVIRRLCLRTTETLRQVWLLLPLLALLVVYWAVSLATHLNIGHRHLLPIYPPLFILAGAGGHWLWRRRWIGRLALLVLLTGSAVTAATIRPHYLAYFNAITGGPAHAYHHLVESSLDWGQDLPGLARWIRQHAAPRDLVHLAYFGMGSPEYEGIVARRLPSLPLQSVPHPTVLRPGLYAISATVLQQPYSPHRGPWTAERERQYQEMRGLEALARQWEEKPRTRDRLPQERAYFADESAVRTWTHYESLRFARLCHYLRARQPDAQVGYSILIYRLTAEQLQAALHGSLSDLANLIEHARPPK